MWNGHLVIDADSHKCENPIVFLDYLDGPARERVSFVRDRYGEQRLQIVDRDPQTGAKDFRRLLLQPEGYGKGTYRPYHQETTIGGLFNRVRIEHMDREGVDTQLVYGSITMTFNSLIDSDLGVSLCRAYNDYIHEDCRAYANRLHPVAALPLRVPEEAVAELRRCVEILGMPAVSVPPNIPVPHPNAPECFPEIRVPKHLSHPDFEPLLRTAADLDVPIGVHGAPGAYLAGGTSDQLDSFTLVHVFANRAMQQMAMARLLFDGVLERLPTLRVGFLEAGCGWLPDFLHSLCEHWEKRIVGLDPNVEPNPMEFLREFAAECSGSNRLRGLRRAKGLLGMLFQASADGASPEELANFRDEHPALTRSPLESLERGQLFFTFEPGDPAPGYLRQALGDAGARCAGFAIDYGHWDAELDGCVERVARAPGIDERYAAMLLSGNALAFYGNRLQQRLAQEDREALIA